MFDDAPFVQFKAEAMNFELDLRAIDRKLFQLL